QQGRSSTQLGLPVNQVRVQIALPKAPSLPFDVILVGRVGQHPQGSSASLQCTVGVGEISQQNSHRPTIRDDMVDVENEKMVVRPQRDSQATYERALAQFERLAGIVTREFNCLRFGYGGHAPY